MSERVFVDTNVLVYARDATELEKQPRALEWMNHLWRTRLGALSFQVLQEFYVTVTDKLDPGMEPAKARADVRDLLAWKPVLLGLPLLDAAWGLQDRYAVSWWDSLIVAAAKVARCNHLLSEDLQDGQSFEGLTVVNPFTHSPLEVLRRS